MKFLYNLDNDLKLSVRNALRDLWTHTSTALEGNTLTLGDTAFVLNEGLTIGGKSLKEHQEVIGHAKAIELIYAMLLKPSINEDDLFLLHRAVLTQEIVDIYKPVGGWKEEPNGTYSRDIDGKTVYVEYAAPQDVSKLMGRWLELLNSFSADLDEDQALEAYSQLHLTFVGIHPFYDGNGRLARLLANIAVLKSGHVPIMIDKTRRQEYIELLSAYQQSVGQLTKESDLIKSNDEYHQFKTFCKRCWALSLEVVEEAHITQAKRLK
jgi:Fic family protein